MDIKGEINSHALMVGDLNTPLTSMDRIFRQEINKATVTFNDTLDQMDLIDIYRTFHTKVAEYKFFSGAHGIISKIDHILQHKISLNKFKKFESISSISLPTMVRNQKSITILRKLENTHTWKLSNILLNNEWVNDAMK